MENESHARHLAARYSQAETRVHTNFDANFATIRELTYTASIGNSMRTAAKIKMESGGGSKVAPLAIIHLQGSRNVPGNSKSFSALRDAGRPQRHK